MEDARFFVILTISYVVGLMNLFHSSPAVVRNQDEVRELVKRERQYIMDSNIDENGDPIRVTFTNAQIQWWKLDEVAEWIAFKDDDS